MHPLGEGEAPSSEHTRSAPTSSPSTPTSEPVDMEYAQQEERAISEKIRNVQERKYVSFAGHPSFITWDCRVSSVVSVGTAGSTQLY